MKHRTPSSRSPPIIYVALIIIMSCTITNSLSTSREELLRPKKCYLGIDVGTQGTKVLAYSPEERKVIARSSISYDVIETTVPGRAEQDPAIWMDAVSDCFEQIGNSINTKYEKDEYKICGIGVSGQQHGMVALSSDGNPLRPAKLWCDVEAIEETEYLKGKADHLSFLTPGFTSPKILWMKRMEPDLFEQTKWFVLPHDYVTMKLGNLSEPITDAGDASGNGMMDTTTRENSKELADAIDPMLYTKLSKIINKPNEIVGYLDEYYFKKLLSGRSSCYDKNTQIPISIGSGDNMCSALGVGCVDPGEAVVLSLGTSGTIFGVSETPVPTNTPLAPFCDATGRYLPLACTMSCTGVLTQVLNEWTEYDSHETASREASKVEIGCHGITFLPYLGGERTPNWPNATGTILGITSSNMKHVTQNPALLYRACMEGITFVLANALQYFSTKDIKTLLVVGGGAKNKDWCQMIADVLDCRLVFPVEAESAALGAAFQAGAAATHQDVAEYVRKQKVAMRDDEVITPSSKENHAAYQKVFERYKSVGEALFL